MTETLTDRRSIILQATLDLAAERGLLNTTIALIARQADSSPGIIYHYFESKDEIIHTLYEQVLGDYAQALLEGDPLSRSGLERYKQIWLNTFHYFVDHPRQASFMDQYKNSAYVHAALSIEADPNMAPLFQALRADIVGGLIKDLPMDVIYALSVDVAKSLAKLQIAGLVSLDEATLDELAEASCRALLAHYFA